MSNPNSFNNIPSPQQTGWDKLSSEPKAKSPEVGPSDEKSASIETPFTDIIEEAEKDVAIEIDTKRFRRKMARLLAEQYLNERTEKNVETRELDQQARETHDKKDKKSKKRQSSLKQFRGKLKNFFQNNLNRDNEYAFAVRAILGEIDAIDENLSSLRERLDELTAKYVNEAEARYARAVTEDEENFNGEGEYEGVLAAGGELRTNERTTEKINAVVAHITENRRDFLDEEGNVDNRKLSEFIDKKLRRAPQDLREKCFAKCHSMITHSISFDRAKNGMKVYHAELVGGTSTENLDKFDKLIEKIRDRGIGGIPNEYLAAALGAWATISKGIPGLIGGTGLVATISAAEAAKRLRRDREVLTEANTNGLLTLGEQSALSTEKITGNGEYPDPINGLGITNEGGITVEEARKNENNPVAKIRAYERRIADIGAYEMADARKITKEITEAKLQGDIKRLVKATAEAETRLRYTYDEGKAVIRFSSFKNRPDEERALRDAVFEAKKYLSERNSDEIDEIYDEALETYEKSIKKDIKQKDRALRRQQIIEALKSGARAGVIAGVSFLASQELIAALSDKTMGVFETMLGKNENAESQTILSRLIYGERFRPIQGGNMPQQTVTGLNEKEAQDYARRGWLVKQEGSSYTASGYIIDGKIVQVDIWDNNTPNADGIERVMKYKNGFMVMPITGTSTSSADGGQTVFDWGQKIQSGQAGIIKILPDGTGIFIPGGNIDESSGKILLGDGSITRQDLQSGCRYCAAVLDENGTYNIVSSVGEYVLKKQPGNLQKLYSAILPAVTKVAMKLSTLGVPLAMPNARRMGKLVTTKDPNEGPTEPPNIDEIIDKLPPTPPVPPTPPIHTLDIKHPGPNPDPTPLDEIPDENNNPNPDPTPNPSPDEKPRGENPEPRPVPPTIPDDITPSPFIPPKPTGWGPDPIPPTGGTSEPEPRPEPIGESQNPGRAEGKFGVRTIFVPSDLETAEMFEELDRRFIALTGERPRRKEGVLESEHSIMEFVGPISSRPNEHGNIETDMLNQSNIMYQLRKKGE